MDIDSLKAICAQVDDRLFDELLSFGIAWMRPPVLAAIPEGQILQDPTMIIQAVEYWQNNYSDEFSSEGLDHLALLKQLLLTLANTDVIDN